MIHFSGPAPVRRALLMIGAAAAIATTFHPAKAETVTEETTRRSNMKAAVILAAALATTLATSAAAAGEAKTAIMYKQQQCGCCDEYANYLEKNGFKVSIKSLTDQQFESVKRTASVPRSLYGCHTLMLDGYVVEGLVPVDTLNKLLAEKPNIKGISLPGMPAGAPGMLGRKSGPLVIYEIDATDPKVFATE